MITPSVKLAISAGMAPFSTCSGPVPRFQNTEEGRGSSGHTLPLKTQASFAGCISPVRKHQSRAGQRPWRSASLVPLLYRWRNLWKGCNNTSSKVTQ